MYQNIVVGRTSPIDEQNERKANWLTGITAAIAGLVLSATILPLWLPGLASSVMATDPKIYWYLSRATAIVGFIFLSLSMFWGLLMTAKMAKQWPGVAVANDMHKFLSLFGIGIGLFHAFILLGDKYIGFSVVKLLIPFANPTYRPTWVGLGQIALYMWAILIASFLVRRKIGHKLWRALHILTFFMYAGVLLHGIFSGTDTGTVMMDAIYWGSGGIILFLTFYRILYAADQRKAPQAVKIPQAARAQNTALPQMPQIPPIKVYESKVKDNTSI